MSNVVMIQFKCRKKPHESMLTGFQENRIYRGRTFNGLYQISEEWASTKPTLMMDKKDFDKYFEVVDLAAAETKTDLYKLTA